jgi:hypothetical protein
MPCSKIVLTGTLNCLWQLDRKDSRYIFLIYADLFSLSSTQYWIFRRGGLTGNNFRSQMTKNLKLSYIDNELVSKEMAGSARPTYF